jgi:hypothetical protein
MGIEPTTRSLGSYCSTTELHPQTVVLLSLPATPSEAKARNRCVIRSANVPPRSDKGFGVGIFEFAVEATKHFIPFAFHNVRHRVVRVLGAVLVPFNIGERVLQFLAAVACLRNPHMDSHPVDDPIFLFGDDDAPQHGSGIGWLKRKPALYG